MSDDQGSNALQNWPDHGYLRTMLRFVMFAACLLLPAAAGFAQSTPKPISEFKDWTAYTVKEKGGLACYMASQPKSTAPKGAKRGLIWTIITHRPYKKVKNEVSIYVGYPFKGESEAIVDIDGKQYKLFTSDETAWASSPGMDATLVQAMRKGAKLVVRGVSQRGTKTTDRYSLSGFTAAHKAISKACKVK